MCKKKFIPLRDIFAMPPSLSYFRAYLNAAYYFSRQLNVATPANHTFGKLNESCKYFWFTLRAHSLTTKYLLTYVCAYIYICIWVYIYIYYKYELVWHFCRRHRNRGYSPKIMMPAVLAAHLHTHIDTSRRTCIWNIYGNSFYFNLITALRPFRQKKKMNK